jgi:DNA-binding NarL/FixJ family response regulator
MIKNIILADRHQLFMDALGPLLEKNHDYCVCGMCPDEKELFSALHDIKANVVILDAFFSGNGEAVLKKIHERFPECLVIMLGETRDTDFLYRIYKTGISGFVLKTSGFSTLEKALKVVLEGGQYIEPVLIPSLKDMIDKAGKKHDPDEQLLTRREMEILVMVSKGLYNKEIASNLNIKEKTVKNHMTNLFKKINVEDRIQAAVFAVKNGYVDPD